MSKPANSVQAQLNRRRTEMVALTRDLRAGRSFPCTVYRLLADLGIDAWTAVLVVYGPNPNPHYEEFTGVLMTKNRTFYRFEIDLEKDDSRKVRVGDVTEQYPIVLRAKGIGTTDGALAVDI